jgi:SH3-like domain-containing protein
VVTARDKDQLIAVSEGPAAEAEVTAQLQAGVVTQVKRCDGKWCKVNGNRFEGWVPQERLWGVYPNEKVD